MNLLEVNDNLNLKSSKESVEDLNKDLVVSSDYNPSKFRFKDDSSLQNQVSTQLNMANPKKNLVHEGVENEDQDKEYNRTVENGSKITQYNLVRYNEDEKRDYNKDEYLNLQFKFGCFDKGIETEVVINQFFFPLKFLSISFTLFFFILTVFSLIFISFRF